MSFTSRIASGLQMLRLVAFRQPFVAVTKPDDFVTMIDTLNRGRRDDAVDAGSRTAADENSESAFVHVNYIWLLIKKTRRNRMSERGKKFHLHSRGDKFTMTG